MSNSLFIHTFPYHFVSHLLVIFALKFTTLRHKIEEVENAARKRGAVKSKLTTLKKYVTSLINKTDNVEALSEVELSMLEQGLSRTENLIHEFDEIQLQVELTVADLDKEYKEREEPEHAFYKEVAEAKMILKGHLQREQNNASVISVARSIGSLDRVNSNGIKLPTIQLPKFNGVYQTWLEFRDPFKSLIHTNNSIGAIQKYHYLRASLESDAAQMIKSIGLSAENYTIAWDAVCERYNNTRVLIHNHAKTICNVEPVGKESASKIRKLVDTVSKNLRALDQLEQPTSQWDTLLVYII